MDVKVAEKRHLKKLYKQQHKKQKRKHQKTEEVTEHRIVESNGRPRHYTVSVALPGSIVSNAQSPELRSYLAGQIARALTVFTVDEVVVFSEQGTVESVDGLFEGAHRTTNPNTFLARVLQYLETPQYLRKRLFPVHKDLQFAGLLNPLDAPHHLREDMVCKYREGVTVNRPVKPGCGSFVDVGLQKEVQIDRFLRAGVRVTVELNHDENKKKISGTAVSPLKPRECDGFYWGYTTRLVSGISEVFTGCPYQGGYDCSVGTSERGKPVESAVFPPFKHLLIVFGGLGGLEECVTGDEKLKALTPDSLFDLYLNTCSQQGSRTIRTEEALLVTLSGLRGKILANTTPP